jgi:peroxiredoxin
LLPGAFAAERLTPLPLNQPAPEINAMDLNNKAMRLSEFRGKVIVLVFWASTQDPFKTITGQLAALTQRMEMKPFVMLGVNGDKDRGEARRFSRKENLKMNSWQDGGSTRGPIATAWGVDRWPFIYVIDQQGVIRFREVYGESLNKAVDKLLAGPAKPAGK